MAGKVVSVLGELAPAEMGITLTHEHTLLQVNSSPYMISPRYVPASEVKGLDFSLENLGLIRQYPYSCLDNLKITTPDIIIEELTHYKNAGGRSIVDCSCIGIRTDDLAKQLVEISQHTDINIILGTGFYCGNFVPEKYQLMSAQEIANIIIKEITEGIDDTSIRCGLIGEVGCSHPITDFEKRSLQGAAIAQQATGAPLILHPGRDPQGPFEMLDILESAGADISRTVMSHMDRTILDPELLLQFAKRGSYIEYDLFGVECSHYQLAEDIDMLNDAQRIKMIKLLIDNGYQSRLLLAHDIHSKHRMVQFGGHGYGHILRNIVPKMAERGISHDVAMKILTDNPREWLTFGAVTNK